MDGVEWRFLLQGGTTTFAAPNPAPSWVTDKVYHLLYLQLESILAKMHMMSTTSTISHEFLSIGFLFNCMYASCREGQSICREIFQALVQCQKLDHLYAPTKF